MDNRYEIAGQNGMSREFADWFFDNKKAGCGNVWFMMMAAMWEGWQGRAAMLQGADGTLTNEGTKKSDDSVSVLGIGSVFKPQKVSVDEVDCDNCAHYQPNVCHGEGCPADMLQGGK